MITHHVTTIATRVAGRHVTDVYQTPQGIQVLIPGLAITLDDVQAARCWCRAWEAADKVADHTFKAGEARPYRVAGNTRTLGAVTVTGWQPGRQIYGVDADRSPSGLGELKVRLGEVAIICDDLPAFETQRGTWSSVWALAQATWLR